MNSTRSRQPEGWQIQSARRRNSTKAMRASTVVCQKPASHAGPRYNGPSQHRSRSTSAGNGRQCCRCAPGRHSRAPGAKLGLKLHTKQVLRDLALWPQQHDARVVVKFTIARVEKISKADAAHMAPSRPARPSDNANSQYPCQRAVPHRCAGRCWHPPAFARIEAEQDHSEVAAGLKSAARYRVREARPYDAAKIGAAIVSGHQQGRLATSGRRATVDGAIGVPQPRLEGQLAPSSWSNPTWLWRSAGARKGRAALAKPPTRSAMASKPQARCLQMRFTGAAPAWLRPAPPGRPSWLFCIDCIARSIGIARML